jgi:lipoprotein-anchoring transpeptidase ErfK/SrfK
MLAGSCGTDGPELQSRQSDGAEIVIGQEPASDGAAPPTSATDRSTSAVGPARSAQPSIVAEATVAEITARTDASEEAEAVAVLDNPRPSGAPLVFRAVDEAPSVAGWIQVQLPVEPNGTVGWVRRDEVSLSQNPYRLEIDRGDYRLQVFRLDEVLLETTVAIGTGETPTPVGQFYLMELLAPPDPTGPYGPFAFGLSGFSEVLDGFGGADEAIIGLHGTNEPSSLGSDVSHGCIRLANDVITELATYLPLGTPVYIV